MSVTDKSGLLQSLNIQLPKYSIESADTEDTKADDAATEETKTEDTTDATVAESAAEVEANSAAAEPETTADAAEGETATAEEDATADAEPTVVADDEPPLEADQLETVQASADVEKDIEKLDELSDAKASLEHLTDMLRDSLRTGGISQESAAFADIQCRAIMKTINMSALPSAVLSIEEFGGLATQEQATRLSMEGVGEMARAVGDFIVRQLQKAWATLTAWVTKLFSFAPRIVKRAEKIIGDANKIKAGDAKEQKMKLASAKNLSVDGKAPVAADLIPNMDKLVNFAKVALGKNNNAWQRLDEAVLQSIKQMDIKPEAAKDILIDELEKMSAIDVGIELKNLPADRFGAELDASGTDCLPGNKMLVAIWAKDNEKTGGGEIRRMANSFKCTVVNYSEKEVTADFTAITPLTKDEILKVANAALEIAKSVDAFRNSWSIRSKRYNQLVALAKSLKGGENFKGSDDENAKAVYNAVAAANVTTWNRVNQAYNASASYLLNTAKHALDYCAASINQYTVGTSTVATTK